MKLLVLFALIGFALALTPGTEFRYRYEGRIGLGLPEIRNKFSGTGIKSYVTVQVFDTNNVIFKMSNIYIGEYVGDAGMRVTNPLPLHYTPLADYTNVLEEPFEVFFNKNTHKVMVVPERDVEWVVNIRKSIAHFFFIEPIFDNFHMSEIFKMKKNVEAFTLYEPTLFGKCSVDYTFLPIDMSNADDMMMNTVDHHVHYMTRSINFDKCEDEVSLMHVGFKIDENLSKSQYKNVASRSSVMNVKIVGTPGNYFIKESNVQGLYSVNPFGVPTDKLTYLSNLTLVLESKTPITHKFVVPTPTKIIKNMYYETASPFKAPMTPVPFVNYYNKKDAMHTPVNHLNILLGIDVHIDYAKYMVFLDNSVTEAAGIALRVGPVPTGKVTPVHYDESKLLAILETATFYSLYVDLPGLEKLFEKYYHDNTELGHMKLKLFIDVCVNSGMNIPLKMILNEMKKERITPERITSIFSTFTNTFHALPLLPEMLMYVKTLDFTTHPIMTTNVYINFASVLRKSCFDKKTVAYEIFGSAVCDVKMITEDFVPFLKQKFHTVTETYQKLAIVHAMGNLGTVEAVHFLSEIIHGNYEDHLRTVAIYGLTHYKVHKDVKKDYIFNTLMPVVHNIKENHSLRQFAIWTLMTWRPTSTWWHRLAVSTWKEPSTAVGSFIYFLIKNYYHNTNPKYIEESKIAHFILPLTKPFPPSVSHMYFYGKYSPEIHSGITFENFDLRDEVNFIPRTLYTSLTTNFGGVNVHFYESMYHSFKKTEKSSSMVDKIMKMMPEEFKKLMTMSPNHNTDQFYKEMMKIINPSMTENTEVSHLAFIRMFEHLQFLIPSDSLLKSFSPENMELLKSFMHGKKLHLTKFFSPMISQLMIPTELGLPLFTHWNTPTFVSVEGDMKFTMGGRHTTNFMEMFMANSFGIDLTTNFKFTQKHITELIVFLPWTKKMITSGVETLRHVNLPATFKFSVHNENNIRNISMTVVPTHMNEFAAVYAHNIPFVSRKFMTPVQNHNSLIDVYETLSVNGHGTGLHNTKYVINKMHSGLDAHINWEGDLPYPFTYGNFYNIMNNPYKIISEIISPSSKFYATSVVFNFGTSETKAFHPSISFTLPTTTKHEYISPVKKMPGVPESFIFHMRMTGMETRFFESKFEKKILSQDENTIRTEYMYKYSREFPRIKPQAFCVHLETRLPAIYNYHMFLKHLTTHMTDYSFAGKVRGGTTCQEAQFATIKGSVKISEKKKAILIDEITKELNINQYSPLKLKNKPIYDYINMLVEYKEPLPHFFTNMTYQTYDIIRGSQFPHVYNNYYNVKNPKGRFYVEGERYLDGSWNLRTELPTENMHMDHFEFPYLYKLKFFLFSNNKYEFDEPIYGVIENMIL